MLINSVQAAVNWVARTNGAKRALLAVYEAHLGLGPETSLTDGVLAFFEASNVEEVLHRCTARGTDRHWLRQARLAPILLNEAAHGDKVACEIVRKAGIRNADVALIAARAVGLDHPPVRLILSGGVLRHPSGLFEEVIRARFAEAIPEVEIVSDVPEPVVGAMLLAADLYAEGAPPAVRQRLIETLPGPSLFAT